MNEVKFPITSIHHIYLAHVENRSWKESKVGYPKYYQVGTLMVATFKDVNSLLETMLLCLITEAALFNSADLRWLHYVKLSFKSSLPTIYHPYNAVPVDIA